MSAKNARHLSSFKPVDFNNCLGSSAAWAQLARLWENVIQDVIPIINGSITPTFISLPPLSSNISQQRHNSISITRNSSTSISSRIPPSTSTLTSGTPRASESSSLPLHHKPLPPLPTSRPSLASPTIPTKPLLSSSPTSPVGVGGDSSPTLSSSPKSPKLTPDSIEHFDLDSASASPTTNARRRSSVGSNSSISSIASNSSNSSSSSSSQSNQLKSDFWTSPSTGDQGWFQRVMDRVRDLDQKPLSVHCAVDYVDISLGMERTSNLGLDLWKRTVFAQCDLLIEEREKKEKRKKSST